MTENVVLTNTEDTSMLLIANAGDARSKAFEALSYAKKGEFEKASSIIQEADDCLHRAHEAQTSLLINEANGNRNDINVLLVHAQDHFMTSMLALELVNELIQIYKTK